MDVFLYWPFVGVVAGAHGCTWIGKLWSLPSGAYLGHIEVSAEGDIILAQYIYGIMITPEPVPGATSGFAKELCRLLKGD